MLLTIENTRKGEDARELGYLLQKHPDRLQSFELAFGQCHIFYPEASNERCRAALLLEIDPVKLVRGSGGKSKGDAPLAQYVNDRPYVASSLMSVALGKVFRSAMNGQCKDMPQLAETALPLTIELSAVPVKGGEPFLQAVFEPLGYEVEAERLPLDERFSEWGESRLFQIRLKTDAKLKDVLNHLYVLIPVLDREKHYYVGAEEIEKLLRRGEQWLKDHPLSQVIATRYLRNKKSLAALALERLAESENEKQNGDEGESGTANDATAQNTAGTEKSVGQEEALEKKLSLNEVRMDTVVERLKDLGVRRVADLGCGEGKLLSRLVHDFFFQEIVGMDVSIRSLEIAERRLKLDRMPERKAQRLKLLHGSLMYRDSRLNNFDAATCIEVIEHLDVPRLNAFEKVVFGQARPSYVLITTPNREYNKLFESLEEGRFRHSDHRFEWSRAEFRSWSKDICQRFGYSVDYFDVGTADPELGPPTQMGVFCRGD
ncbi:3' terminal RNA ribose 2'-O-methyltransferase Hen1 [bacterium]|nr:3' terminal RNA ribose 2'-O-methyltransferase Hen1 [bacterium]